MLANPIKVRRVLLLAGANCHPKLMLFPRRMAAHGASVHCGCTSIRNTMRACVSLDVAGCCAGVPLREVGGLEHVNGQIVNQRSAVRRTSYLHLASPG